VPLVIETTSSERRPVGPHDSARVPGAAHRITAATSAARCKLAAVIERHRVTLIKILVALLTFVVVVHSLDLLAAAQHLHPR
jgi:hypothetical protein